MLSVISDTVQLFKCVCVHKKGYHLGYNTSPQGPYDPCQVPIVHSDGQTVPYSQVYYNDGSRCFMIRGTNFG